MAKATCNNYCPMKNLHFMRGADRVTNWYKRELRIFANLNRITQFPDDRVLFIVGSGHLAIQRNFALDSPQFCLVDAEAFLK
jgi:hypothetical protein